MIRRMKVLTSSLLTCRKVLLTLMLYSERNLRSKKMIKKAKEILGGIFPAMVEWVKTNVLEQYPAPPVKVRIARFIVIFAIFYVLTVVLLLLK